MAGASGRPVAADRTFERLYRRHVEDVYRYALAVLANRSDAEDVTQTTFLNAYRSYRSGTLPATPLNWLISIAHNVCRQRFRSAARRPTEVALDARLAAVAEDGERFRAEDIRRALAALTFAQRSALALRELEGRSYREIAETLELSEGAVETLIFRARKAFREQLEETLTCTEAEQAISRQLDGALGRSERGALRSHLRECEECSVLARRFRAQRSAFKRFVLVPLPQSLASFPAGGAGVAAGSAAVGAGLGLKALALGSAAIVAVGVTAGEVVTHAGKQPAKPSAHPVRREAARPATLVRGSPVSHAAEVWPTRAHQHAQRPSRRAAVTGLSLSPPSGGITARRRSSIRHRPVHPSHPASGRARAAEVQAAKHAVMPGNSEHSAGSPARRHVTHTAKPKPATDHPKPVVSAARSTSHPAPKQHTDNGARTSKPKPDPGPPSTVPAEPGPPTDQVHGTGKPADTPGGQLEPKGQGNKKE